MVIEKLVSKQRIYLFAAFIFLVTAWFSEGYNHFDEHFQILEFAGLKLGLTGQANLPWEYGCKMRPAIQPLVVYLIQAPLSHLGAGNPFLIAFIVRLLASALTFLSIHMVIQLYAQKLTSQRLLFSFLVLSFFLWFVPYNAARFSSETISGRIFLIGLTWFFLQKAPGPRHFFVTGLLLGLTFIIRYQMAFMLAGFALWLIVILRPGFRSFIAFASGIFLIFVIGILIDRWFYNEWVLTSWNYFNQNILLDKASDFGISPWWYYFEQTFMNAIPPFSLVYILAVVLYCVLFPRDVLTWCTVPFLLLHFMIPHKEIRFLFPLIGFLPVMIIQVADLIEQKYGSGRMKKKWVTIPVKLFWISNVVMLVVLTFRPADDKIALYRKLWVQYPQPAKLCYFENHPYHRARVDVHFYKKKNLTFVPIDSIRQITFPKDTAMLLAVTKPIKGIPDNMESTPVYSSLPPWVTRFNFNNWVERTSFWYVYELKKKPSFQPDE